MRITLVAKVTGLSQSKMTGDEGEVSGSLDLEVSEMRIVKDDNQFMALAENDD